MSFSDDRFSETSHQPEQCKECGSTNCQYDTDYGYWECNDCHTCWGYDKDDPDYDEMEDFSAVLPGQRVDELRAFLQNCLKG